MLLSLQERSYTKLVQQILPNFEELMADEGIKPIAEVEVIEPEEVTSLPDVHQFILPGFEELMRSNDY